MRFVGVCVAALCAVAALDRPATAADLGGDCCADLEERIAELEATTARKGNRKVSLRLYGNINKSVMWWDDGTEQNVYVVTNQTTRNVFGFEGNAQVTPLVTAGFRLEFEARTAASDFVDQGSAANAFGAIAGVGAAGRTDLSVRQANWWLEHKNLGRVTVGRGSNATDGIAEIDLSGSTAAAGSAVEAWNETFFLTDKSTGAWVVPLGGTGKGLWIDIFRGNLDGGVGQLVRYDSPVFGGFIASASWGEDDDWDVGLRYAGEGGGFQYAAGIGYHEGKITDTDNFTLLFGGTGIIDHEEWVGSASILHLDSGVFATVAGGSREWPNSTVSGEDYVYGKSGIYKQWSPLGKTSIYGEYYHIWDVGSDLAPGLEESASMWGAGVVQHIDAAAMEVYVSYRHYWADDVTSVDFDNINQVVVITDHDVEMDMVMGGARIQF